MFLPGQGQTTRSMLSDLGVYILLLIFNFNCYFLYYSQNKLGETPLHIAAKYGHIKCVRLLLEKGADIRVKVS